MNSDTGKTDEPLIPESAFVMGLDSWIGETPALVAISRQYNKDYSLEFAVKYIQSDSDRIAALNEGTIDVTEISLPSFIKQLEKYPDCGVIVGLTDFSRGADGIVAKTEVKDLNDMDGRTVSYVKNGTGKFILNKFLRLTGLRYQDIEPIERDSMSEVIADLKSGDADLAVSWSPDMNLAVRDINAQKAGSVKMLITTAEAPNLIPTVLVVSKRAYGETPEKVTAFLKTWYASVKYMVEKPEKAQEKLVALMNEKADEYGTVTAADVKDSLANIKLMALNENYSYFTSTAASGSISSIIDDTVVTWKKFGDITGDSIKSADLFTTSYMDALKAENDSELIAQTTASSGSGQAGSGTQAGTATTGGNTSANAAAGVFAAQTETSIDANTEVVARVDIPPVYYDSGKATVKAESMSVLNQILDISQQFPEYYIIIDAHTDSVGTVEANLKLSRERAATVKAYLVSKGISANRIVARGWGESKLLVADEKTEADKAKNRRTEFILSRENK
ncbi:MAG: OmpA family protein [Clostridiales bacterium]|nr:OmpA family protein [Clostridiales bacterium]